MAATAASGAAEDSGTATVSNWATSPMVLRLPDVACEKGLGFLALRTGDHERHAVIELDSHLALEGMFDADLDK